jgi:hypothetical protein
MKDPFPGKALLSNRREVRPMDKHFKFPANLQLFGLVVASSIDKIFTKSVSWKSRAVSPFTWRQHGRRTVWICFDQNEDVFFAFIVACGGNMLYILQWSCVDQAGW